MMSVKKRWWAGRCARFYTYPSEADLVPEEVEATDAVLGIFVVVVLDKAKPGGCQ